MAAPDRFVEIVTGPEASVPLDEAMLLVAATVRPDVDVPAGLARLDALAEGCTTPTLDGLVRYLFTDLGFTGNREDYYDPRNSMLDQVIERRLGIPISLSVLVMATGRRVGVPLAGVAMPGHFLLRDKVDPAVFVDPFAGGAVLEERGCERAFRAMHGPSVPFEPRFLEPVGAWAILGRVLANLKAIYAQCADRSALAAVLRLRVAVPGVPSGERRELAQALAADGDFAAAATELEGLAATSADGRAEADLASATRFRARLN